MITPEQATPRRDLSGSRGAIRPVHGGCPDPFYDFDIPARIAALMQALAEHPATRPLLVERELSYRPRASDGRLAIGCTRCTVSPCSCEDLTERANDYMATAFTVPELAPLFEAQRLVVVQ